MSPREQWLTEAGFPALEAQYSVVDAGKRANIRDRVRAACRRLQIATPAWLDTKRTNAETALPGKPLAIVSPEIRAWMAKRQGNEARVLSTGEIVLCRADGVHRTYPTITAACAAAVWR